MTSNMASLMDLVSQNQPKFQTHQALLLVGLQNDFVTSEGRLPVDTKTGFLERIQTLIPKFRDLSGNVIWVQTLYEADRIATGADTGEGDTLVVNGLVDGDESIEAPEEELAKEAASPPAQSRSSKHKQRALDLLKRVSARRKTLPKEVAKAKAEEDEELFLLKSEKRTPACVPDTRGAEFADAVATQVEESADIVVQTTNYSAFQGTDLLKTLRARLITELFICGCITNVSVLATVIDAARHGVKIHVIEDCLGFRKENRHDLALKRMEEFFSAYLVNSEEILKEDTSIIAQKTSAPVNGTKSDLTMEERMAKMSLAADIIKQRAAQLSGAGEEKPELIKSKVRTRKNRKSKKKAKEREESKDGEDEDGQPGTSPDQVTDPPITASPAVILPSASTESQPTSKIAKAGSVADLRQKEGWQHTLKNASSVPALSAKAGGEEKERNKLSDFSDRVRMSLSRAPKSESGSESKGGSISPAKSASTTSKQDDKEIKQPSAEAAKPEQLPSSIQEADPPSPATPPKAATMGKPPKLQSLATFPVLGPGDEIAEGDSRIIHDFFPPDFFHPSVPSTPLKDVIFTQLYNEVRWQKMLHQQGEVPRLVCCQGAFGDDGSMPVYRHPADQTLPLLRFSPKVHVIRKQAEKLVGHPLNHVLIQLYRSGNDFISEHSDKTLDIVKGSSIVNVSFGSQRTMRLRTKRSQSNPEQDTPDTASSRSTQRVALPHNSMFILGLGTNAKWLHGIQPDKRLPAERSETEKAYNGIRISLTFRHIGTYLDCHETVIWGQGASSKTQRDAVDIIANDAAESKRLITAFSRENHTSDLSWHQLYGEGSDVLHLHAPPPPDTPLLFLSTNPIENNQVLIALSEAKIRYSVLEPPDLDETFQRSRHVSFRDIDAQHTEILTPYAILLYLDRYHPFDKSASSHLTTANAFAVMSLTTAVLEAWQKRKIPGYTDDAELTRLVAGLEESVEMNGGPFVAGRAFSVADAFVWPVVHVLVAEWEGWSGEGEARFRALEEWYRGCWRRKACVKNVVGGLAVVEGKKEGKEEVKS
jgi:nicotinamidase-related amidase/alkylated DNA repair dioxygenase AlkB